MASYQVGIDFLLEGSDSDDDNAFADASAPPKQDEPNTKESEKKQEPELTGMALLKSMYAKEEARKRSASAHSHIHKKVHLKIKVGTIVDIYSSSRKEWVEGAIKEIKGDTICIIYGKKMKWLHKTSKNFRPKQNMVNNAANAAHSLKPASPKLAPSSSPPAAFSSVLMEDMNRQASYDVPEYDEIDHVAAYAEQPMKPIQPKQPAPRPPPPVSVQPAKQRNMSPSVDHYEYDVRFSINSLGLMLGPVKDGVNCMVKKCMTQFALKNVDPGSIVCGINGKNVMGLPYETIREMLKQNAALPPVTVSFRSKLDGKGYKQENNVNERGLLQIKVVGAMQLKHAANYVGIRVGNAYLTTKELKKNNHHPEWMQVISFKNFRCDHGKFAIVTAYDKSAILKDKKVGTCKYTLPIRFNTMSKDTVNLKNDKGKICGCIMLNSMVVPPR